MSLIQDVIDYVEDNGPSTGEDIAPHFPNHTPAQVFQALQNAKYEKRLVVVDRRAPLVIAKGRKKLVVYDLPSEPEEAPPPFVYPQPLPFNSVFQMGERAGAAA